MGGVGERLRESGRALADVFRNPQLRRLELAWAGSIVGDWAYAIGVSVYAYEQGGAVAVGVLGVVRYVSMAVIGPFTSTLADRFPRRLVMVSSDLLRGMLVAAAAAVIALDGPALAVYALAVATSIAATPFRPAQAAMLPSLARNPGELTAANVASSTIESIGFFAGPALGGLLLAVADIPVVYLFNAITFVWSAALVLAIRPQPAPEPTEQPAGGEEEAAPGFLAEAAAGFHAIAHDRDLRLLVGLYAAQTVVAGASLVFSVVVALELLDLGQAGVGYLDAMTGIGGLVGGFVALVLAQRGRLALDFGIGIVLWGLPLLLITVSPTLPAAVAALILVGLGNSLVDVNAYTILQRIVPDAVMGRVFGAMESILIGTMALGSLLMPLLIHLFGIRAALAILGVSLTLLVALGLRGLVRIDRTALAPAGLELLRGVPILGPLPEPVLTRLARTLHEVRVAAGQTVFREGDVGDRFYVIESGEAEILGRRFGAGESFGEIALLRDIPRTATVTAVTDLVLRALAREDFIPAVTGNREALAEADVIVSTRMAVAN